MHDFILKENSKINGTNYIKRIKYKQMKQI